MGHGIGELCIGQFHRDKLRVQGCLDHSTTACCTPHTGASPLLTSSTQPHSTGPTAKHSSFIPWRHQCASSPTKSTQAVPKQLHYTTGVQPTEPIPRQKQHQHSMRSACNSTTLQSHSLPWLATVRTTHLHTAPHQSRMAVTTVTDNTSPLIITSTRPTHQLLRPTKMKPASRMPAVLLSSGTDRLLSASSSAAARPDEPSSSCSSRWSGKHAVHLGDSTRVEIARPPTALSY